MGKRLAQAQTVFAAKHPDHQLNIQLEETFEQGIEALLQANADITTMLFARNSQSLQAPQLPISYSCALLSEEPLFLRVTSDDELYGRGSIMLRQLDGRSLLMSGSSSYLPGATGIGPTLQQAGANVFAETIPARSLIDFYLLQRTSAVQLISATTLARLGLDPADPSILYIADSDFESHCYLVWRSAIEKNPEALFLNELLA